MSLVRCRTVGQPARNTNHCNNGLYEQRSAKIVFLILEIQYFGSVYHDLTVASFMLQVIKMLAAVVILFAICWGPIMLNNLLVALDVLELLHRGSLKPIRQTLSLMSYANSCINPIVYGFMSKNFRATFKHTACLCCLRKNSAWATRENARSSYLQNRSTSLTFTRGTSLQSGYDKNSAGVRRCQYATTKHHSSKVSEVNLWLLRCKTWSIADYLILYLSIMKNPNEYIYFSVVNLSKKWNIY